MVNNMGKQKDNKRKKSEKFRQGIMDAIAEKQIPINYKAIDNKYPNVPQWLKDLVENSRKHWNKR